jgi:uncharacterized repeat protein (TIGR03803 family)
MTPSGVLATLVNFTYNGATNVGAAPEAGLVQGSDGNFYGTTTSGGTNGYGTVFKVTPAGVLTTLVNFTDNGSTNAGAVPAYAALVQGSDGNFYGTTASGGANGYGTVFQMTLSGELTTLVNFTGNVSPNQGLNPSAALVQGSDGNFYGTTALGGANNAGTVFQMTPTAVLTTLVNFTGNGSNDAGSQPSAGLVQGSDGNFYGTTFYGGTNGLGTVFKMTSAGVLTTLVNFTGNGSTNVGGYPNAGLVQGSEGNFYGTTAFYGTNGNGTVFKMTPAGVLTPVVYFTNNGSTDAGDNPKAGLIQGSDGNFYGTTYGGGTNADGTVFKMTPAGMLTTLVNFTGNGSTDAGSAPYGGLVLGRDGNFYGTTLYGGTNGYGTVFKMTSAGVLTTLVSFSGTGLTNAGSSPAAGLVQGSDGNFYGTTGNGGASNDGTVFQMTPAGVLTTIYDFSNDSYDNDPTAPLINGSDGNLYGTTSGGGIGGGSIYRLVLSGPPNIYPLGVLALSTTSAVVSAQVNPRGATTSVLMEYGTNSTALSGTVPIASDMTGYQVNPVGTTLGLNPGTLYYYQFQAMSSSGTTVSPVESFSTVAPPAATATPATAILNTSAQFNGTVNAENYATTVVFQYGTDGNTFPYSVPAVTGTVMGNTLTAVSAIVAGLTPGTTYYYRVVATNTGGPTTSGESTFTTLTPPTATVGGATPVSTTSVQVSGTLNAQGSATEVVFQYGTDGVTFPYSEAATPATASGTTGTPVTAVLTNLSQGTTYSYQVQGTSAGGVGTSTVASFTLETLSGFTQVFPNAPPASNGFLLVNLSPSSFPDTTLLPGWRFVGQVQWQPSGTVASGLVTGTYGIEYEPVPGYVQPLSETVEIVSGAPATVLNRSYYEDAGVETGALTVTLEPSAVAASGSAQWEFVGENGTQWRNSGVTASSLPAGTYLVECTPVAGYATPSPTSVTIQDGVTTSAEIPYYLPDATVGALPAVVPYQTVISGTNLPYAYVGQIQSDAGSATGFVVASRVVATAAHVVFDDGTLSATTGVQWLLQEYAGTYQPAPLIPRGFYDFAGYAAQRAAEGTPGQSSPASQNLDVAAMYFLQDAGNGGYSGYLASDSTDNEFLESSNLKILVGYPVDNIPASEQGQMFATAPANVNFTRVPGVTASGTAVGVSSSTYRIYTTTDITSNGGNSGGPLCVQYNGGTYYPAAIYLGGSQETVVRAIDGDVVDMFNDAVTSGNGGGNQGSGGITETNSPISSGQQAANLEVTIAPAGAVTAGGEWRLKGASSYNASGKLLTGLTPSKLTLQFTTIAGFDVPADQPVTLSGGQQTNVTFTYSDTLPPSITSGLTLSATGAQPLSYQIAATQSPSSFGATSLPAGLTVAASSGLISGTPLTVGTFSIPISASNVYGTGDNTLVLTIQSPFPLWQTANFGANAGNPLIAGDTAINNPAGIENMLAYGLGLNPFTAGAESLPVGSVGKLTGTNYLSLQFTRSSTAVDLIYTVLATSNLGNPSSWTPVATYSVGTWSGPGTVIETGTAPNIIDQVFDSQPASSSSERFIELNITVYQQPTQPK